MEIHIHIHHHGEFEKILVSLHSLHQKLTDIMATQKELTDQVNALTGRVVKIGSETRTLLTKVEELLAIIAAGGEVSAELQTAVDDLQAQVTVVDELVPDAPTEPPVE